MKNVSGAPCFKAALCVILILSVVSCTREQERSKAAQVSSGQIAAETTLLATVADDVQQAAPSGHGAQSEPHNQPIPLQVQFSASGRGVVYTAAKGGKVSVVHNGRAGRHYTHITDVVLSLDGQHVAYGALDGAKWRMVFDGREGRSFDWLLPPVISPDGQHVVYQAKEGGTWYMVVDNTLNGGTSASYTTPAFSSDSRSIVYVEAAERSSDMRLIVSDLKFRKQSVKSYIGDLLFTTNRDKTRIAAAQVVGDKLRVIDFSFATPDLVHEGPLYDVIDKLTFSDDGRSLSYCALKDKTRLLILDDKEEVLPKGVLPELEFPVVRPDKKGVGVLLASQGRISLHQGFFNSNVKGKKYDEAANLTYSKDSRLYAYAARNKEKWFIVVNGSEGPAFDRVVTPMFSPDGKYLVYRARKDGKRFVVVADASGKTIKQRPSFELVFQTVFVDEGKSIAYGVKDGNRLVWKVEKL